MPLLKEVSVVPPTTRPLPFAGTSVAVAAW